MIGISMIALQRKAQKWNFRPDDWRFVGFAIEAGRLVGVFEWREWHHRPVRGRRHYQIR